MKNTERWTATDISDLTGKTAIITGGNSGVGFETALELARHGATTIIACRSASRGEAALERIKGSAPSSQTRLMLLDLGIWPRSTHSRRVSQRNTKTSTC